MLCMLLRKYLQGAKLNASGSVSSGSRIYVYSLAYDSFEDIASEKVWPHIHMEGFVGTEEEVLTKLMALPSKSTVIHVYDNLVISKDTVVPRNVEIVVNYTTIAGEDSVGSITVAPGATLTNNGYIHLYGEMYVLENAVFVNNYTLTANGGIIVKESGAVVKHGSAGYAYF